MLQFSVASRSKLIATSIMLVFFAALMCPARADDPPPSAIDPSQVLQRTPAPVAPIRPSPSLAVPTAPTATKVGTVDFVLTSVAIDGATVFAESQLRALYATYLGREIGLADVQAIVANITAEYRRAGYFLSHANAPPQSLDGGVLHVHVVEGYIKRVVFPGATSTQADELRRYTTKMESERPLRISSLERALLLAENLPGIQVSPAVNPIDEARGEYELVMTVDYRRMSGYGEIDNRGPNYLGPWESQLIGSIGSVLRPFDQLGITFLTVPNLPRELLSEQLLYDTAIGSGGARAAFAVARSDIHPQGYLAPYDLSGTAMSYTARLSYPLLLSRAQALWLAGTFNLVDSREDEPGFPIFDDHLRVLRADVTYSADDPWGGSNLAFAEVSQGLNALGASQLSSPTLSTVDGHSAFTKIVATFTRDQSLFGNFSAQFDFVGQKAAQPLLSSEQFALGGARFGRGYDPAEVMGDDALAGSLELRYGRTMENPFLKSYQLYAFYDLGEVWNIDADSPISNASLASAGGGIRLALPHNFIASLEIAKPLTHVVAAEGDKPWRAFVRISVAF